MALSKFAEAIKPQQIPSRVKNMLRRVGFRRVPTAAYSDFGKLIVLTNYRDANNLSKLDMRKLIQFAGFESVEPMALSAKRQVFVLTFVEGV